MCMVQRLVWVENGGRETQVCQGGVGGGKRRCVEGTFPCRVRGSDKEGNKTVKVPSNVTFVTEEQFVCIMGTLTYLALYVIRV